MPFRAPLGEAHMNGQAPRFRASLAHLRLNYIFISVTLVVCLSTAAGAQDLDEVSFSGVVADPTGAVIPDARVTARFINSGAERATATDGGGGYRLVALQ